MLPTTGANLECRECVTAFHDPTPEHISLPSISKDYVSIFPNDDIPSADAVVDTDVHANTPTSVPTLAPALTIGRASR